MSNNRIGVLKVGKFYKTEKGKKIFIFFTSDGEMFDGVVVGKPFVHLWYKDGKNDTYDEAFKDNIIEEWEDE